MNRIMVPKLFKPLLMIRMIRMSHKVLCVAGICSLLLLLFSFSVFSQTFVDPYVPSSRPDRINLTVTEDPSTSVAVTWRTDTSVKIASAEIVPSDGNPLSVNNADRVTAVTETLVSKRGYYKDLRWKGVAANYHSVVFKGLRPNTLYSYRVGSDDYWSEWFQFKTAGTIGDEISFLYFGDAQTGLRSMWAKVIRKAYAEAPHARLMIYAGDIVNRGNRDEEWGEFFEAGSFILATIPNMPSPGNHDYGRENTALQLSSFWRPQFTLPENGPEGLKETCYYTDIQNVRFISLNSYVVEDMIQDMPEEADKDSIQRESDKYIKKQQVWLNKVLGNNPNKWTVVVFHHPIFSPKGTRDNKWMREAFKPIFDKYKVDLVLQGHDHTYARGMGKIPMKDKETRSATMYVVSVSGPKMTEHAVEKKFWMDKSAIYTQLYQVVTIKNNRLAFRTYTSAGALFDAFDLIKHKGRINQLVNRETDISGDRGNVILNSSTFIN